METGFPRLRLISGASDFLGAANIKYQQKVRVLNRIRALDVDIVLIDLGAGTSFNILDFFLISDLGMLTVVPEPTSIENGYRFIKSALYRRLRSVAPHDVGARARRRGARPEERRRASARRWTCWRAWSARTPDAVAAAASARSRPSTRASWSTRCAAGPTSRSATSS